LSKGNGFPGRSMITKTALSLAASAHVSAQGLPELPIIRPHDFKEADFLYPQRPAASDYKKPTTIQWRGESVREEGTTYILTNAVIELEGISNGNVLLMADSIEYNHLAQSMKAVGAVRLEHPAFRMRCQRLEMQIINFDDVVVPSGEAWGVTFEFPPSWTLNSEHVYFVSHPGDSLGVIGELIGNGKANNTMEFRFKEVSVSPCPQDNPGWMAKTSFLNLKTGSYSNSSGLQGYATLKNIVLKIGPVPVMWMPWVLFPARIDRAAGILPPTLGYNSKLGATLGMSYFQPLGHTADVTFSPTWYSNEGVMWGGEIRWEPEVIHRGNFLMDYIRPRSTLETRYRLNLNEIWDLENGWFVRADINYASDQLMDVEFGRINSAPLGSPKYDSSLFVGKNFKWAAFSLIASDQRSFFQLDDPFFNPDFPGSIQKIKIPEGYLRLYPIEIGNFYFDASARSGRFGYRLEFDDDNPTTNYFWSRDDYQIRLLGQLGQFGPLRADLQMGARFTRYGAILNANEDPEDPLDPMDDPTFDPFKVEGPPAQRWLASSRLQVAAPQFARNFLNLKVGRYSGDIKHIFEPVIALTFNTKNGLEGAIPSFDEVDTRPGVENSYTGERSIEFGLNQHFFGRPDSTSNYLHVVRWRTSIKYYSDPVIMPNGQIKSGWVSSGDINIEPSRILRLSFKRASDSEGSTDSSVSADLALERSTRLNLAFFNSSANLLGVRQRGIRVSGLHTMWDNKLRFQFEANYDFGRKTFSQSQVALAYVGPCVAYSIRYRHMLISGISLLGKEDRVDLALNLRNLGELFSAEIGGMFSRLFK